MDNGPTFQYLMDINVYDVFSDASADLMLVEMGLEELEEVYRRMLTCEGIKADYIEDGDDLKYFSKDYDTEDPNDITEAVDFRGECVSRKSASDRVYWRGYLKHTNVAFESRDPLYKKDVETAIKILTDYRWNRTGLQADQLNGYVEGRGSTKDTEDPAGDALIRLVKLRLITDGPTDELPLLLAEAEAVLKNNPEHPLMKEQKRLIMERLKEDDNGSEG